ncbi:MAG: hypothetical protein GWP70_04310 [Proteobacteria bacterium]|nr:hypothetical protein [Pseudomonadota bacterium]
MRDGINTAKRGLPSVALVTEEFWPQGNFTAVSLGMPEVPRLQLPHPLAGTGQNHLREVAAQLAPQIIEQLKGE